MLYTQTAAPNQPGGQLYTATAAPGANAAKTPAQIAASRTTTHPALPAASTTTGGSATTGASSGTTATGAATGSSTTGGTTGATGGTTGTTGGTSTSSVLPGVGTSPTMPSLDALRAALGTIGKSAAQMGTESLQYQDQALADAQGLIDSIERSYNEQISTAAGNAAAASAAGGFAGSVQAGDMVSSAMAPGIAARAGAVATAMKNIRSLAASQYQAFQTAETSNAKDTISLYKDAQTQVVNAATAVWSSGTTPSDLKTSNPDEYNYLLQYGYNGDENAMNAAYVASSKANLLNNGQPVYQAGSQMVFGQFEGMNPDGTPNFKFTPVTLPGDIPLGYKMQSNNQTTNGQVITTFAPVDANGNIIYDPSKPNGGIVTQINGQTVGAGNANINPVLSGQTIGSTTLGIVPTGVSETAAISGQGIINGTNPPVISSSMSGNANQVKAYLAANNFDLTKASLDWTAVSKYVSTLNSATQVRFRQAVQSVPPMLDNAQTLFTKLQTDIQGTPSLPQGLTILNSANLAMFASGAYGPELQSDAITLQNQITDVTAEIGTVFKGGNAATDLALQNGASLLKGSWDAQTFSQAVQLLKENMQYRANAVLNAGVAGTSDNTYASNAAGGQAEAYSTDTTPAGTVDVSSATW